MSKKKLISSNGIQNRIYTVRGLQVMVDSDLAELYRVESKRLNEQVKRNIERFPAEFMFQLTTAEFGSLRSQFATLDNGRGKYRKYLPYVFTEHGVAMLAGVLKSETAVKTSIQIINAFVAMRRFIATNAQVFQRLDSVERKQIEIKEFMNAHDRFIIIDKTIVYHFGASLKDLGKKWFAFSKMDIGVADMLGKLAKI